MPDNSALLIWERIQPVPASTDLSEALRGEVRDPLWLLARQWQLGEFKGEDAGTAAFAHLLAYSSPIQQFKGGQAAASLAYPAAEQPLNALVEQIRPAFDLHMRLEAGRRSRQSGPATKTKIGSCSSLALHRNRCCGTGFCCRRWQASTWKASRWKKSILCAMKWPTWPGAWK